MYVVRLIDDLHGGFLDVSTDHPVLVANLNDPLASAATGSCGRTNFDIPSVNSGDFAVGKCRIRKNLNLPPKILAHLSSSRLVSLGMPQKKTSSRIFGACELKGNRCMSRGTVSCT